MDGSFRNKLSTSACTFSLITSLIVCSFFGFEILKEERGCLLVFDAMEELQHCTESNAQRFHCRRPRGALVDGRRLSALMMSALLCK
jgi:hypothetical protein